MTEIDYTYVDKYLNMILSKIITNGTLSLFNGEKNIVLTIERIGNDDFEYHILGTNKISLKSIDYNDIINLIIEMYENSNGKITSIYRVFTGKYNKNTNGEFRELWGDLLYVEMDTSFLKSQNVTALQLSNVVVQLDLTEEEIKVFGLPEEYIFIDDTGEIIMGLDLV